MNGLNGSFQRLILNFQKAFLETVSCPSGEGPRQGLRVRLQACAPSRAGVPCLLPPPGACDSP